MVKNPVSLLALHGPGILIVTVTLEMLKRNIVASNNGCSLGMPHSSPFPIGPFESRSTFSDCLTL